MARVARIAAAVSAEADGSASPRKLAHHSSAVGQRRGRKPPGCRLAIASVGGAPSSRRLHGLHHAVLQPTLGNDPTGPLVNGDVCGEPAQHTKPQRRGDDPLLQVLRGTVPREPEAEA